MESGNLIEVAVAALVGNPVYPQTGGREHHNALDTLVSRMVGYKQEKHFGKYLAEVLIILGKIFKTKSLLGQEQT